MHISKREGTYIEPIKRISEIQKNRSIKHYDEKEEQGQNRQSNFGEKGFGQIYTQKKKISKIKKAVKGKVIIIINNKEHKNQSVQEIYKKEMQKTTDSQTYNRLNRFNESTLKSSNNKLKMQKAFSAYGKTNQDASSKVVEEKETNGNKANDVKANQINSQEQVKSTKKQEMEEFKKTLKAKQEWDKAYEQFRIALNEKNKTLNKVRSNRSR